MQAAAAAAAAMAAAMAAAVSKQLAKATPRSDDEVRAASALDLHLTSAGLQMAVMQHVFIASRWHSGAFHTVQTLQ
jgi:nitrite reductase/ring-hydroxylating ferredoxin subunit